MFASPLEAKCFRQRVQRSAPPRISRVRQLDLDPAVPSVCKPSAPRFGDRCPPLSGLLSEEYTDLDAQTGEVFVDRDPRYFHYILQYLRSGRMELPAPPLTPHGLLDE